ncbi:MAG: 30S ribosomal protein S4 [Haloferacaceae archaeon]|jgi:small subunit ribosomal protein S4
MSTGQNTKRYETPNHPYQGERIADEGNLLSTYGLKNKQELWRTQSQLRRFRREARRLLGEAQGDVDAANAQGADFLARLRRIGVLGEQDDISDVLSLSVTDLLERRLQSIVYRQGLASTPEQARQFVVHGHVVVDGARVDRPGQTVEVDVEDSVGFDETSPLADDLHPERAEGQE